MLFLPYTPFLSAGLDPAAHWRFIPCMVSYVYILASRKHGTLYIGHTRNLARRLFEHREELADGFTSRYGVKRLVHYELHDDITNARQRERNLKKWPRAWKIQLIEKDNPGWEDLADQLAP